MTTNDYKYCNMKYNPNLFDHLFYDTKACPLYYILKLLKTVFVVNGAVVATAVQEYRTNLNTIHETIYRNNIYMIIIILRSLLLTITCLDAKHTLDA